MIEKILSIDVKAITNKGRVKIIRLTHFINLKNEHLTIHNEDNNFQIRLEIDCEGYSSEIRNYNDYS